MTRCPNVIALAGREQTAAVVRRTTTAYLTIFGIGAVAVAAVTAALTAGRRIDTAGCQTSRCWPP